METLESALVKVEQEVTPVLHEAGAIAAAVVDQPGHDKAVEYLSRNALAIKLVNALLDPFVQANHKLWKDSVAKRDGWLEPLKQKRQIVEPAITKYRIDQEEKRLDDQRKADAEAKKRAEDQALAAAEAAEKAGDKATAEAILSQPVVMPPVVLPKMETKSAPTVVSWSAEIIGEGADPVGRVGFRELVKAVAAGKAPITCLEPNMTVLNGLARTNKAELKIDGVRVVRREGLRVGAGRAA